MFNIKWPIGFTSKKVYSSIKDIEFISLSNKLSINKMSLPKPIQWHLNSIFQFYLIPYLRLIKLNNNNNKDIIKQKSSIWFSGYREVRNIAFFDFKNWCFDNNYRLDKRILFSLFRLFFLLAFSFTSFFKILFVILYSNIYLRKFLIDCQKRITI